MNQTAWSHNDKDEICLMINDKTNPFKRESNPIYDAALSQV
jgi:hypothetical protein